MDFEAFCQQFGVHIANARADGERYYLQSAEVSEFKSGEQRKPYSAGLYLGIGRREFVPTAALLSLLAVESKCKAILIGEKAEWLFLCGRDVFAEGFKSEQSTGLVLVQNERDENLGLGKITDNTKGEKLLKNILDRGNYLRHETVSLAGKTPRRKNIHQKRR